MTKPITTEPWSVPVALADVPETGRQFELAADDRVRAAVAQAAAIAALPRLEASFDVARHGADGLHVLGRVSATVTQHCVVTLEPIQSEIEEAVDLVFVPPPVTSAARESTGDADAEEPPDALRNGAVDLGAIATEFLLLGIDPYPRKEGAVFQRPDAGDPVAGPFAALASLKKGGGGQGG
jgi:uncharacterized metal-binding protein YceD (DUF177 family)